MPIRGAEYAVDRVVAILQANLSAELDLVDAFWGDGITLGDVPDAQYFKYPHQTPLVHFDRAILVYATGTDPIQIDSIANTPGRYVAKHLVTLEFHLKDTENDDPLITRSRVQRTAIAIERVLPIKNATLGATVTRIRRIERATYHVERGGEDEAGQFTGRAVIPFVVQVHENL